MAVINGIKISIFGYEINSVNFKDYHFIQIMFTLVTIHSLPSRLTFAFKTTLTIPMYTPRESNTFLTMLTGPAKVIGDNVYI